MRMPARSEMIGASATWMFMFFSCGWACGTAWSGGEPIAQERRHGFGALERGHVAGVFQHLEARPGYPVRELLEELHRHDPVEPPRDDQRRAADRGEVRSAVDASDDRAL